MTAGATKELRLSVDKKRKHILCRSRPHSGSSSSLQALLLSMVVDRTKECIVGCTKSPFSLPYKKNQQVIVLCSTLGYIYPHCIAICHLSRVGIVFICPCSTREKVVNMLHNKCHHAKIRRSNYSFSNAHKKQMEK